MSTVARCPLCGAEGRYVFEKQGYAHQSCTRCASLFISPPPSNAILTAYYRDAAAQQNSRICWQGSQRHAEPSWRLALCEITAATGRGPLLDVGCGAGQFLAFARQLGWEHLHGVELSPLAASAARTGSGATIQEADVMEAPLPAGRFVGITLWDVFEHVLDPRALLRRAFELLAPGGVLVLGTPHRHGITLRLLGQRALIVMPPEHVFLASRSGVLAALEAEGFEGSRARTIDVQLREWTSLLGGLAGRKANGGDDSGTEGPGTRSRTEYLSVYERVTGSRWFASVQAVANGVLRATRLGDQLIVIARRKA